MERTKKKSAFRTVLKWLVVAAIALAVLYHLPLRRTGNKVGDLFLKRLIPGGNLRFKRVG